MRAITLAFAVVLSMAVPAVAQEWTEYQNIQDGFKVVFPGQPKVAETTWKSEFDYMKLYILEGTVPRGHPEPALFQASAGWVDKDGNGIRYQSIYANQFYGLKQMPPPSRGGGGRGAGGATQGQGGGGGRRGGGAGTSQP